MIFDAGRSITWASRRGLGPGNLEFFGPQMAVAYRLDAISKAQPPPTCPSNGSARIKNHYAKGRVNHRFVAEA
jgi:hypothetical protein